MKIILLAGKPNTGKTTTLNLLYDQLTNNGKENIVDKREHIGSESKDDFYCTLKYNEKYVGIFSMDDIYYYIVGAIVKYANYHTLILAYNTNFAAGLDEIIKQYDYHMVIKKIEASDDDNNRAIREIIEQLPCE